MVYWQRGTTLKNKERNPFYTHTQLVVMKKWHGQVNKSTGHLGHEKFTGPTSLMSDFECRMSWILEISYVFLLFFYQTMSWAGWAIVFNVSALKL